MNHNNSSENDEIPIIPFKNCLLVSIQRELHDRVALQLADSILEKIKETNADGVILDLTAVEIIDSYITRIINNIGNSTRSMGAKTVVVGIRPTVAMTLVEMGIELDAVETALNIDEALSKLRII